MKDLALYGMNLPDLASLLLRQLVGWFFILARFRWFFDPSRLDDPFFNSKRHEHLVQKLCTCGYGYHPTLTGLVACVEVLAGGALVIGLLTNLALVGLLGVLLCATFCTGKTKVLEQGPVDCIDCVSCYLWRVEGVYIAIVLALLCMGPGAVSLDALVWR